MTEKTAGAIAFVFADKRDNRIIELGGAAWLNADVVQREWNALPTAPGETLFLADLYDAEGVIVDDRMVTAETVEAKLGKPIAALIEEGRRAEDKRGDDPVAGLQERSSVKRA